MANAQRAAHFTCTPPCALLIVSTSAYVCPPFPAPPRPAISFRPSNHPHVPSSANNYENEIQLTLMAYICQSSSCCTDSVRGRLLLQRRNSNALPSGHVRCRGGSARPRVHRGVPARSGLSRGNRRTNALRGRVLRGRGRGGVQFVSREEGGWGRREAVYNFTDLLRVIGVCIMRIPGTQRFKAQQTKAHTTALQFQFQVCTVD